MKTSTNELQLRTAKMCIERSSELSGSKGKFCVETAKKIVSGIATNKELKEFNSYSNFISLSFC